MSKARPGTFWQWKKDCSWEAEQPASRETGVKGKGSRTVRLLSQFLPGDCRGSAPQMHCPSRPVW